MDASGNVTAVNTFGAMGLISRHVTGVGSTTYTFDERGNVAQRLDASGSVISSDLYSAFGTLQSGSGNGSDPFGFGAQYGYYTDAETGLVLCQQRYYDPGTGRWVNRDPIGYEGGNNLYRYCDNNPVMLADPSGLIYPDIPGYQKTPYAPPPPTNEAEDCLWGADWAIGYFFDYLLGVGPNRRTYSRYSLQSRQMKHSRSGNFVRAYIRAHPNGPPKKDPKNFLGTWDGYTFMRADGGLIGNGTEFEVGGFGFNYTHIGDGHYLVRIDNDSSLQSLIGGKFYHGEWIQWERASWGFGPLGNIHQNFYYVE